MNRILITGANGFVGKALCAQLLADGHSVLASVRAAHSASSLPPGAQPVVTGPLTDQTDWLPAIRSVDVVVHLAARVHIMHDVASDPLTEFRRVNVQATIHLVQAALAAGVKRFVFLSSIGVNGNSTPARTAFTEINQPAPHNPYSLSKLEAEQALRDLTANSSMSSVILRAPLVYGPGNPGNALRLLHAVYSARPLPFASVRNLRSLIYLGNLVDAIVLCATHPAAAQKTYLVSDQDDVSTPELIHRIAASFNISPRLWPFPPALMFAAGALLGKRALVERLIASLAVDSSRITRELGWKPPFTMAQGLQATAKCYIADR
jgi:nucleoside-diphosphate-sugar epimerase